MASPLPMASPTIALPPSKRQKLSPTSSSPSPFSTSPSLPHVSLPGTPGAQPQQLPQAQQQQFPGYGLAPNGQTSSHGDNTPRSTMAGTMGPPQKPADKMDKPVDINDLNDLITGSGIDIREEENYLAQSYRNQHHTSYSSSFPHSPTNAVTSPDSNAQIWALQSGLGPFQHGAEGSMQEESTENSIRAKHELAARQAAEIRQHHPNDPFVHLELLRLSMDKRLNERGVRVKLDSSDQQGQSILTSNPVSTELLSLLSLAAQQRIRALMEEAHALSRVRQLGSHGLVPPEWADIAVGIGEAEATTAQSPSISGTAWDKPASQGGEMKATASAASKKRPAPGDDRATSNANLPTPPTDTPPSPLPTRKFPAMYAGTFKSLSVADRKLEETRLSRRNKRKQSTTSDAVTSPNSEAMIAPATPSQGSSTSKLTKKERDKAARGALHTEAAQHRNANATASMALGGFGKSYSWLSGGTKGAGGASRPGTSTPKGGAGAGRGGGIAAGGASAGSAAAGPKGPLWAKERVWGDWREDGPKGKGMQPRDWARALEVDGRMHMGYVRAWNGMKQKE